MHPDTQMIEFIYHELDESEEQQFRAHVDGCSRCVAELASLEETLVTVRLVPDEEPPLSITTRLLHEAAKHGPKPASMGLWSRFLEWAGPIGHHPALAAAASLLFVGGIAGYLTFTGVAEETMRVDPSISLEFAPAGSPPVTAAADEVPEPVVGLERPVEENEIADLSKERFPSEKDDRAADTNRTGRLAPWKLKERPKVGNGLSDLEQVIAEPRYNTKPRAPRGSVNKLDRGYASRDSASRRGPRQRSAGKPKAFGSVEDGLGGNAGPLPPASTASAVNKGDVAGGLISAQQQKPAPATPAPQSARSETAQDNKLADSTAVRPKNTRRKTKPSRNKKSKGGKDKAQAKTPQRLAAEQLHEKAALAAKKSNCAAMRRHVQAIARQDRSYYKSRVVKDRRLDRCSKKTRSAKRKRSAAPSDSFDADDAPAAEAEAPAKQ